MSAAFHALLGLPLLVSLGTRGAMPKILCFVASALALLVSGEPYRAVLPWAVGMTIATIALIERFRHDPA
jgi:hypothetical protein